MNKQEIIVAFAAARIAYNGYAPGNSDVDEYGNLAEYILSKWPDAVDTVNVPVEVK